MGAGASGCPPRGVTAAYRARRRASRDCRSRNAGHPHASDRLVLPRARDRASGSAHRRSSMRDAKHTAIEAQLDRAAELCLQHGATLTELRRHVLMLILSSERPLTAYQLLARLKEVRRGAARRRSTARWISCSSTA